MKKNAKNSWILFAAIMLTACSQEDLKRVDAEETGKEKEIAIAVTIPDNQSVQLRSLTEEAEKTVSSVDILAFRVDTDGKEYYDYAVKIRQAELDPVVPERHNYTVVVREKVYPQRFVMIANLGTKVQEMLHSVNWKYTEKNAMLATLEYASSPAGSKWNTSENFTAFPMWGESDPTTISYATTTLSGGISMIRMVAKINVQLDKSVIGLTEKFQLKSVYLYNTNSKGYVVPNSSAVSHTSGSLTVTKPSIPSMAALVQGPLAYNSASDFASPGELNIAMRGNIYLFETLATPQNLNATCLIIGGLFNGDTQETYYRVDFVESDGKTRRDILRNHLYTVNIVDVKDRGHATVDDAFTSVPVNMEANILTWNEGGFGDVSFDFQYYLSVNRNLFNFAKESCDDKRDNNVLTIVTDYYSVGKSGWTIEKIESVTGGSPDWLVITDEKGHTNLNAAGEANVKANLLFTYTTNNTGATRAVRITFAAGRLRYAVTVTQSITEGAFIYLYEGSISENSTIAIDTLKLIHNSIDKTVSKQFTVRWAPVHANLVATMTNVSIVTPLDATITPFPQVISNGGGSHDYRVTAEANSANIGKSKGVVFVVTNEAGETAQKRLVIQYVAQ